MFKIDENLTLQNVNLKKIRANNILLGCCIGLLLMTCYHLFRYNSIVNEIHTQYEQEIMVLTQEEPFNPEALKKYLKELNIKNYEIVYAQACLETNYFTSRIFRESCNLFGMKLAAQRPTTAKGEQYGHAYYNSWKESVQDFALFYSRYVSTLSEEQYYNYLGQYYAEDPRYIQRVKEIKNKVFGKKE